MIRGILSLAAGGGIAFGVATYEPPTQVKIDDEIEAPAAKNTWTLSRAGKIVCQIERTQKLSDISYEVVGSGDCAQTVPGLERAYRWHETVSGVNILDAQGEPVVKFATAELDGMQSYYPAHPVLLLEPQR